MAPGRLLVHKHEGRGRCRGSVGARPEAFPIGSSSWPAGVVWWVWLWRVRWVQWTSMAVSMCAVRALLAVMQGFGEAAASVPTWLGV
eukprot:scaffold119609_cov36-Tisochrysis_lutea.AAC.1